MSGVAVAGVPEIEAAGPSFVQGAVSGVPGGYCINKYQIYSYFINKGRQQVLDWYYPFLTRLGILLILVGMNI